MSELAARLSVLYGAGRMFILGLWIFALDLQMEFGIIIESILNNKLNKWLRYGKCKSI